MKKTKQRFLSLLLTLIMVFSMVPAAQAAGTVALKVGESKALFADEISSAALDSVNGVGILMGINYIQWTSSAPAVAAVSGYRTEATVSGLSVGTAVITASLSNVISESWVVTVSPNGSTTVVPGTGGLVPGVGGLAVISPASTSVNVNGTTTVSVMPTASSSIGKVTWTSSNSNIATVTGNGLYAVVTGKAAGTAAILANVYAKATDVLPTQTLQCTVTVGSTSSVPSLPSTGALTLSQTSLQLQTNGYAALTAQAVDATLQSNLANVTWSTSNPGVVTFATVPGITAAAPTGAGIYLYGIAPGYAVVTATLTVGTAVYTASCGVTVGSNSNIDILYTPVKGQTINLNTADFQRFWSLSGATGSMEYVVLGSASGTVGNLVYGSTIATQVTALGRPLYVKPAYQQLGVSDVRFVPSSVGNVYSTGSLVVPFTAYGTALNGSSVSKSGTMHIVVTDGSVQDINYQYTNSGVKLNSADFVNVYRQEVSTAITVTPTLYVQFLDLPIYGSLYQKASTNPLFGTTTGKKLTSSDIATQRFTNTAAAVNGIDTISYIPGSYMSDETIRYAVYNAPVGGSILYIGEINFVKGKTISVKYYGNPGKSIKFQATDFTGIPGPYFSFNAPVTGALYKNTTKIGADDTFTSGVGNSTTPSINTISYLPAHNFTGVVEIPFSGYNLLGTSSGGTVKIYVAKAFSDVSKGYSWASDYIIRLTAEGVVNGVTATTYAPGAQLKYGEALKLIMEATGTSASLSSTGHWAQNYLNRAHALGLVSSKTIDLNAKISRDQVAELAAKALGLGKATSVTGAVKPSDSTNGYVYALYNAGILNGNTVNGKNYYYGSNTINRAEISKIICLVSDYYAANK